MPRARIARRSTSRIARCSRFTSRGESARKAADRHAIPKVYDSPDEMLKDREIEVVDIGVPPERVEWIIDEGGKSHSNVVIERKTP